MVRVQDEQDVLARQVLTIDVAVARDGHRLVLDADHEVGLPAIALAFLGCLVACGLTWRAVPLAATA